MTLTYLVAPVKEDEFFGSSHLDLATSQWETGTVRASVSGETRKDNASVVMTGNAEHSRTYFTFNMHLA
jgi:hypothetical protein